LHCANFPLRFHEFILTQSRPDRIRNILKQCFRISAGSRSVVPMLTRPAVGTAWGRRWLVIGPAGAGLRVAPYGHFKIGGRNQRCRPRQIPLEIDREKEQNMVSIPRIRLCWEADRAP
jgi:hypothetical protein